MKLFQIKVNKVVSAINYHVLERLNDLAMIHTQREQLKNLDYENLVKRVY